MMILAPLAASVVQMAISRTREYAADRMGAQICGNPLWLASALHKIAGGAARVVNEDAEHNPATAHMFIINPLSGQNMDNLFSTHPNTDNRVAALRQMAVEGGFTESRTSSRGDHFGVRDAPRAQRETQRPSGPWGSAGKTGTRGGSHSSGSKEPRKPKGPWG